MALEETIDTKIEELVGRLVSADDAEAVRIHTRITELKSLKENAHP